MRLVLFTEHFEKLLAPVTEQLRCLSVAPADSTKYVRDLTPKHKIVRTEVDPAVSVIIALLLG